MGSIYKRGNIYWIKHYRAGEPFWESSRSTQKGDAKRLLQLREGYLAQGRPFSKKSLRSRFEDLAEDLCNDYRARGKVELWREENALRHLAPTFALQFAHNITPAAINGYVVRRRKEGAADGTIQRELTVLRRAFTLGLRAGKLFHRPYIPMVHADNVRKGFFEPEMFEAVRAHLPDYLYPVVTFAYYTGWRKGGDPLTPMEPSRPRERGGAPGAWHYQES